MTCDQGQKLEWLGLDQREQLHWFGVQQDDPLCTRCWEQSACPREFSFSPQRHEILYGSIPLSSRVAQLLLKRARPWIEAAQSYEKNQLGLSQLFLNSLRLTWSACLLADAVSLLRARATLGQIQMPAPLYRLAPKQADLPFD